jgi:aspartyl-tRNA(Asn)/glutamyl-tRNA(Gln) amidotransferase subunit C
MEIGDLRETAELARLNLGDEELAAAFPAFEQMLGFFAAMQAADNDEGLFSQAGGGAGNALPSGQNAVARMAGAGFFRADDEPPAKNTGAGNLNENLLNNAGERDGRFLVIPNVL